MGTERPRVQGYLDPAVYDLFLGWKKQRGIAKESEALNQILKEYFGIEDSNQPSASPMELEAMIDKLLNEKFKEFNLFRAEFKNEVWLQLKKEFSIWRETLDKAVSNEKLQQLVEAVVVAYWSHSIVDINSRLEAVEDTIEVMLEEPRTAESNSLDLTRSPSSTARQEHLTPSPEAISTRVIKALDKSKVLVSEALSELPSELKLTQLARRLNVAKSVVSNRKNRGDFEEWSKGKDPEGLAWQCRKEGQWLKFYPVGGTL